MISPWDVSSGGAPARLDQRSGRQHGQNPGRQCKGLFSEGGLAVATKAGWLVLQLLATDEEFTMLPIRPFDA